MTGVQHVTDTWFVQPSREFARRMDQQETPVWMYHFTKPVWGWMGAAHAAEIGYVFGNLENPKPDDDALSKAFMDYWVQFATTGNPNAEGQPNWPAFSVDGDQHLAMDKTLMVDSKLRRDACDIFDEILEARRQRTAGAPPNEFLAVRCETRRRRDKRKRGREGAVIPFAVSLIATFFGAVLADGFGGVLRPNTKGQL